ncbi:MAG: AAA family ATPase [Candidatus Pacearchaeota archaeon]
MIIESIELCNIRSHKNTLINFQPSSVLLSGDIGSGKSTILLALEFGLFGFQRGELEGRNLLRHGCNEGYVKVNFRIGKKKVSIGRVISKRKDSFLQSDAWLEVDEERKRLSVEEINEEITKLLNFPDPKKKNIIYRFTVYTPQEQMKRILLEKPDLRLDIIRKLFNLDKYKRISANLSIYSKALREDIRVLKSEITDIDEINQKINQLQNEIKEFELSKRKLREQLDGKVKEKSEKEKEIEKIKKEILEFEEKILKLNQAKIKLNEKKEKYAFLEEEIKKIILKTKGFDKEKVTKEKSSILGRYSELQKELERINRELKESRELKEKAGRRVFLSQAKIDQIEKEIESFKFDFCPKCRQKVNEEHKKHVIDELKKGLEENKSIIAIESEKLKQLEKNITELERKSEEINKTKRDLENQERDLELIVSLLNEKETKEKLKEKTNSELVELKNEIKKFTIDEKVYNERKNFYDQQIKSLDEINEAISLLKEQLARVEEKISFKIEEIRMAKEKLDEKKKIKTKVEDLQLFESWLNSELPQFIEKLEKVILFKINKEFETLLKNWFKLLVEDGIEVRLLDDFTPLVEENGYESAYEDLSGGERTALALAYRLALNQLINSLTGINTKGLIILDEPTEGFSQKQLEKMGELFSKLNAEQLLIVSHDPKIESFVDNIIKLVKEDGISYIRN